MDSCVSSWLPVKSALNLSGRVLALAVNGQRYCLTLRLTDSVSHAKTSSAKAGLAAAAIAEKIMLTQTCWIIEVSFAPVRSAR
jgi:hypothetical protein